VNPELYGEGIRKGLEAWTLQNLLDAGMLFIFIALGLMACRAYLEGFRGKLVLRLSVELWDLIMDLLTDLLLLFVVLIGMFTCNPDIMADIKIALPWIPLAQLLAGVALLLRAFAGGKRVGAASWWLALGLVALAGALSWFGFTFVMEGASDEYSVFATSQFWQAVHAMRSDVNRELALTTFAWAAPAFAALFLVSMGIGLRGTVRRLSAEHQDPHRRQGDGQAAG